MLNANWMCRILANSNLCGVSKETTVQKQNLLEARRCTERMKLTSVERETRLLNLILRIYTIAHLLLQQLIEGLVSFIVF